MTQKNFLYIIGNIISQPFKDLWPRTIRQAIYFIDFYKIIMRNFGMAIVIAISSKCQKLVSVSAFIPCIIQKKAVTAD